MCSPNQAEVEAVQHELLKAGIVSESRTNSVADSLGVAATELWVQDERDFFDASRLYAEMQDRALGRTQSRLSCPADDASGPYTDDGDLDVDIFKRAPSKVKDGEATPADEPRREEFNHARSLLERGIEEMFRREGELAEECTVLREKVDALNQPL